MIFLGLDCSTQTFSATAIDENLHILSEYDTFVHYDSDLPQFGTKGGVQKQNSCTFTTPTLLWVNALDLLLERLKAKHFPFHLVTAISGSAQQHGSVYWRKGAGEILKGLDSARTLTEQSTLLFSFEDSPSWRDSSTSQFCRELEKCFSGGALELASLTGSRAYERFTIVQLAKRYAEHPHTLYYDTERISLVSAFCCSLFLGIYAPMDAGDASGMNCLHLYEHCWIPQAIHFAVSHGHTIEKHSSKTISNLNDSGTDRNKDQNVRDLASSDIKVANFDSVINPSDNTDTSSKTSSILLKDDDLIAKLGIVVDSHAVCGPISRYFSERYHFDISRCLLIAFSGDNLCSFAGLRMRDGDLAVSLGTSDTLFGSLHTPSPQIEGHVFCNPVEPNSFMALICYNNGSLTREYFRDLHCNGDWDCFNSMIDQTAPGNDGNLGFYFKEAEITPRLSCGIYRFNASDQLVTSFERKVEIRALIEGQFLSMFLHSSNIGMHPKRILVTGGASKNQHIARILCDVFGIPVYGITKSNSAALGAAYRAFHGWRCAVTSKFVPFEEVVGSPDFDWEITPNIDSHQVYLQLINRYKKLENQIKKWQEIEDNALLIT